MNPAANEIYTLSLHDALPIYIMPKMTDSLHPGSGGNSTFGDIDMNNQMRPIFYTAVVGWILIGMWIADRKSTRLNSSHVKISYAVFCLKKKIETAERMICR